VAIECTINSYGIYHVAFEGHMEGLMSGKRLLPEQKLDYHMNFTLQQSVGRQFAEVCREENVTVQEKLRFLVQEYLQWKQESVSK